MILLAAASSAAHEQGRRQRLRRHVIYATRMTTFFSPSTPYAPAMLSINMNARRRRYRSSRTAHFASPHITTAPAASSTAVVTATSQPDACHAIPSPQRRLPSAPTRYYDAT